MFLKHTIPVRSAECQNQVAKPYKLTTLPEVYAEGSKTLKSTSLTTSTQWFKAQFKYLNLNRRNIQHRRKGHFILPSNRTETR